MAQEPRAEVERHRNAYTRVGDEALEQTQADAILLIVSNGYDGDGAIMCMSENINVRENTRKMTALLRALADDLEKHGG